MLEKLIIQNIAVIENAEIEFDSGLNVLTGETGAGKSIIIDSINAILGERTSKELIRTGSQSGRVTASFISVNDKVKEKTEEMGFFVNEDDTLTITRTISVGGKNSCKINGVPANVQQLKELGCELINIHGQHDSQALLLQEKHIEFIDAVAGNTELRSEYKAAFKALIKTKKELDALYDKRDDIASQSDYLSFAIEEIRSSDIKVGEKEELENKRKLFENSKRIVKHLSNAYSSLTAENGIIDGLKECESEIISASKLCEGCESVSDSVSEAVDLLDGISGSLYRLIDELDFSPEKLKEIDDRLDVIYDITSKYGGSEEAALAYLDKAVIQNDDAVNIDESIASLEKKLYSLSDKVKALSAELTACRTEASRKFEKAVKDELSYLDMPQVEFTVSIKKVPLTSKGADNIEFLLSANPGQVPKPLIKTASGGELSRIMLAIKNVLLSNDSISTLIFDEIDTGVSGSAAEKIARKLYSVAAGRQVICVTHLARIAAQADSQYKIEKEFDKDSTYTHITKLDFEGRVNEIARITYGSDLTGIQLDSAREMLLNSKK